MLLNVFSLRGGDRLLMNAYWFTSSLGKLHMHENRIHSFGLTKFSPTVFLQGGEENFFSYLRVYTQNA